MINCDNLLEYIKNDIQINSTIIYFGIGTMFYPNSNQEYIDDFEYKNNQQFPPFLHDAKLKFFEKNVLIILIDPAFDDDHCPYLISGSKNFLHNSWNKSSIYSNLYESSMGISVVTIKKYIRWDDINTCSEYYNIKSLLIELSKLISNPEIDSLLFYHEFTGSNVILLESMIKKSITGNDIYDDNKICIDITRGADLSCYFNLTNPENYPVIKIDENFNTLKYINPSELSQIEMSEIIFKYKRFGFDYSINNNNNNINNNNQNECYNLFDKHNTNYLIDKPDELIIFFQIQKSDLIIIKLVINTIITTIRQFYSITNYSIFGTKMWAVKFFSLLEVQIPSINFKRVCELLQLIDEINLSHSLEDKNFETEQKYIENINMIKELILYELYLLFELSLQFILSKYYIKIFQIDDFINQIKNLENKYQINMFVENYINSIIL